MLHHFHHVHILILSNPHIKIEDVIQELQERIQKEKEEKEKAEEKEKCRVKAKGKRKSTNLAEEPFKPA
jgi:predicted transposase YdaD